MKFETSSLPPKCYKIFQIKILTKLKPTPFLFNKNQRNQDCICEFTISGHVVSTLCEISQLLLNTLRVFLKTGSWKAVKFAQNDLFLCNIGMMQLPDVNIIIHFSMSLILFQYVEDDFIHFQVKAADPHWFGRLLASAFVRKRKYAQETSQAYKNTLI